MIDFWIAFAKVDPEALGFAKPDEDDDGPKRPLSPAESMAIMARRYG